MSGGMSGAVGAGTQTLDSIRAGSVGYTPNHTWNGGASDTGGGMTYTPQQQQQNAAMWGKPAGGGNYGSVPAGFNQESMPVAVDPRLHAMGGAVLNPNAGMNASVMGAQDIGPSGSAADYARKMSSSASLGSSGKYDGSAITLPAKGYPAGFNAETMPNNYGNTGNAVNPTTSANSAANPYLGQSNPYLQKNIDAVNADVSRQYRNTVMPAQAGANVNSGSFGNSGLQQMQLEDQRNLQNTLANNSANMRMQDYNNQQGMYQWQQGQNLARENQAFNQRMGINQNNYGQNMGWANYGLNADNQRFNQDMTRNQFDANQYWTGQNFDAGRYDRTFDQNQTQFNNYLNLMDRQNGYNNQDITNSTNLYNTPLNYQQIFSGLANSFGGRGGSTTQNMPGSPFTGAVAGYSAATSPKLGGLK